MDTTIFATNSAGYLGSHVVVELFAAGRQVVIFDDFFSSVVQVIDWTRSLGHAKPNPVVFDARNPETLDEIFSRFNITAVIHLVGLKSDSGSIEQPL